MVGGAHCERNYTSQVVMHGATLVVRIIGTMLVLSTRRVRMMMVNVSDPATLAEVDSNVLHALQGMLDMDADQRHDASGLGKHKESQEQRTKAP